MTKGPDNTPKEALAHWDVPGSLSEEPDAGLINRTWRVGTPPRAILQWVNPIFDPRIHHDIDAITRHLAAAGLTTPRLLPTRDGALYLGDRSGCWRLLSYLPGYTLHRLEDADHAAEAGALVGRFHAALAEFSYTPQAPRRNIHHTPARMGELRAALEECAGHPLAAASRAVGEETLARWATWRGELAQPERICHGDLKISNLRFDAAGRATALLDLDTLGPMALSSELGDAWRSWCNPAGEDRPECITFRLDLFAASARAWLRHGPPLGAGELQSLVPGIERIALELASRFCADAVRNSYFREDRERHPEPGAHNLLRARAQLALARSAREVRGECERIILGADLSSQT